MHVSQGYALLEDMSAMNAEFCSQDRPAVSKGKIDDRVGSQESAQ